MLLWLALQAVSTPVALAQPDPNAAPEIGEEFLKVRDPFHIPSVALAPVEVRSELELIPLEQLKVLGVMTGPDRIKAMVQGPDGKTYFIQKGGKIGTRKGIVTRITPESVLVREKIVNVLGQEESLDTELKLPPESKGKI